MWCKNCDYDLRYLTEPRCPECGWPFDPNVARTFRASPRSLRAQALWRWARRGLLLAVIVVLGVAAWLGYWWWGWHREQRALATAPPVSFEMKRWYRHEPLGPLERLYDRVVAITYARQPLTDCAVVRNFPNLRYLNLSETKVHDLGPLQNLSQLWELQLVESSVTDLGPLRQLRHLSVVNISFTRVEDLTPLGECKQLFQLQACCTPVRDVAPLRRLPELEYLDISDTQVTDLGPLREVKSLREVLFDETRVADLSPLMRLERLERILPPLALRGSAQVQEFQTRHPSCKVFFRELQRSKGKP